MLKAAENAVLWLEKRQKEVVLASMGAYILVISLLCLAKYARLGYDGIDLAYFNQVFWNTVRGRFFQQSIHPHLSLGDHAELIIPLLAPLYAVFQDPRNLLVLQSAVLAAGAWPAYLLARDRFAGSTGLAGRLAPVLFGVCWLLNPLLQNINFFEFHILAFALTPLMFSLVEYKRGRKLPYLAWTFAALLCREDVALFVMAVPFLAWAEKKPLWWKTVPMLVGAAWFVGAMTLISKFAPGGGYKYDIYYAWLGHSLPEVLLGVFIHPVRVALHVLTYPNLDMFGGFILPYALLPLLGPLPLVLALGPAAQVLLGGAGGGEIVLDTHYVTLFIPALTLAAMEGYARFPSFALRRSKLVTAAEAEVMAAVLLVIGALYGLCTIGPLPASIALAVAPGDRGIAARDAREILAAVPKDAPVAASYALMPMLSSRERLYAAHYIFLGVTQFAQADYPPPADLRYTAFDLDDLITYRAQFLRTNWAIPQYEGGRTRLLAATGEPTKRDGRFVLYGRYAKADLQTPAPEPLSRPASIGGVTLLGATSIVNDDARTLDVSTAWTTPGMGTDGIVAKVELQDARKRVVRSADSAFDGIPPATTYGGSARINTVSIPLDGVPAGEYVPRIELARIEYELVLDGDRSTRLQTKKTEPLGSVELPAVTVSRR